MTFTVANYIAALNDTSYGITFADTLEVIDTHYDFMPTAFQNGVIENAAGENSGSCKVFSFAKLHKISPEQTLKMFAQHYQNVQDEPGGTAHANIRAFMKTGFAGLSFQSKALTPKP